MNIYWYTRWNSATQLSHQLREKRTLNYYFQLWKAFKSPELNKKYIKVIIVAKYSPIRKFDCVTEVSIFSLEKNYCIFVIHNLELYRNPSRYNWNKIDQIGVVTRKKIKSLCDYLFLNYPHWYFVFACNKRSWKIPVSYSVNYWIYRNTNSNEI